MRQYLLPATGRFFKVNLHAHTVCSDGRAKSRAVYCRFFGLSAPKKRASPERPAARFYKPEKLAQDAFGNGTLFSVFSVRIHIFSCVFAIKAIRAKMTDFSLSGGGKSDFSPPFHSAFLHNFGNPLFVQGALSHFWDDFPLKIRVFRDNMETTEGKNRSP